MNLPFNENVQNTNKIIYNFMKSKARNKGKSYIAKIF